DLRFLPLRKEPIGDATLIEDLDGARVQSTRARAGEVLAGAPLDNGNVDARQRQLARQHQPRRTAPGDHHRMLGHRHPPVGITPVATCPSHSSAAAATVSNWAATNSAERGGRSAADRRRGRRNNQRKERYLDTQEAASLSCNES